MALSDEERRRLEKLEKELAAAHPDLDRELQTAFTRSRTTARVVYGVLTAAVGFAAVIAGIIADLTFVGAAGFLLMVAGGHWFISGLRQS